MSLVEHWKSLLREMLEAASLETFKVSLGGALKNLIMLGQPSLLHGGRAR